VVNTADLILFGVAGYAAVGVAFALAFVSFGAVRVLPVAAPVSIAARILLIPGAAALWPYVAWRWLAVAGRSG
jgi:hypothetical protein